MFSLKNAAIFLASLSISAYGGSIYTTGFESPGFSAGNIGGQGGWSLFNASASFDNIESTLVDSGSQAAWIIPTGNTQTGMYHSDPRPARSSISRPISTSPAAPPRTNGSLPGSVPVWPLSSAAST
jgi:hypothetical protein